MVRASRLRLPFSSKSAYLFFKTSRNLFSSMFVIVSRPNNFLSEILGHEMGQMEMVRMGKGWSTEKTNVVTVFLRNSGKTDR
jgi:hypothetical protein